MSGHLWCSTGAKACQGEELLGEDSGHVGVDGSLSHEGHLIHLFEDSISLLVQPLLWDQNVYIYKIFKFFTKASIKNYSNKYHDEFHFDICNLEINSEVVYIQHPEASQGSAPGGWPLETWTSQNCGLTHCWCAQIGGDWPGDSNEDIFSIWNKILLEQMMEQFLEKGFGQFVGFLCLFVPNWFALQFFFFFQSQKWKAFTAWLKWWEVSTCGHSKKVMSSRDTIPPSFFVFQCSPSFWWECNLVFFFTPVWLFNSLGYEMKWSVSSTRKRFRSELAAGRTHFLMSLAAADAIPERYALVICDDSRHLKHVWSKLQGPEFTLSAWPQPTQSKRALRL